MVNALGLRAKGAISGEVAKAKGFHAAYISQLIAKYMNNGLEAISSNHHCSNRCNMSTAEEAAIPAPSKEHARDQ